MSICARWFAGGLSVALASVAAGQFSAGNLVVVRVGDGATALGNSAQPVTLQEYTPAGVPTFSRPMPEALPATGFTLSGSATSEGLLKRSVDGHYLTMAGYNAPAGTAAVSTSAVVQRVVARIDRLGQADLTTLLTDGSYGGSSIRCAVSTDGSDLWLAGTGTNSGVRYTTLGSSAATQLSASPTNTRVLGIFNGQLWVSTGSAGFVGVNSVGVGLPTTGGQTTSLQTTGMNTFSSPYDFWFADADTMYVACDASSTANGGGIQKWTRSAGVWSLAYAIAADQDPGPSTNVGLRGLTGVVAAGSGQVTLYATTTLSSGNALVSVVDAGTASTFVTLATAPANTVFRGVAPSPIAAPASCLPVTVLPGTSLANQMFGAAVAVSGNRMVVGAPGDAPLGAANSGSASVYRWNGLAWVFEATLFAFDDVTGDQFGTAVSIDGDRIAVGAPGDDGGGISNRGAAYVFVRSGTTWTQEAKLNASDPAVQDQLGASVSLFGDTVVTGAPGDDAGRGSAYVFTRSGGVWNQQQKLTDAQGVAGDQFGSAVAVSGDTVVVGAPVHTPGGGGPQGYAVVFTRSNNFWTREADLTASDGQAGDRFGEAVALDNDTAAVGAPGDDVGGASDRGSAWVFSRSAAVWTAQAQVLAPGGTQNDRFGSAVALSGDGMAVGAPQDDPGGIAARGSAYFFARTGLSWIPMAHLTNPTGLANDLFGCSVAVSGQDVAVGVKGDQNGGPADLGSVRVHDASVFLAIGVQPAPVAGCSGGPLVMSVTPAGSGAVSVQWQVESPEGSGTFVDLIGPVFTEAATGLTFNVSGGSTTALSVSSIVTGSHSNVLRFRASLANGCSTVLSDSATMTVSSNIVFTQPANGMFCASGGTVAVSATGPLSYQWRIQSPPTGGFFVPLTGSSFTEASTGMSFTHAGANSPTLTISNLSLGSHSTTLRFLCTMSGACNNTSTAPITRTVCRADWDCSGSITSSDVGAYINSWFASLQNGTLEGDYNGDLAVTSADVGLFVSAWFASVAGSC